MKPRRGICLLVHARWVLGGRKIRRQGIGRQGSLVSRGVWMVEREAWGLLGLRLGPVVAGDWVGVCGRHAVEWGRVCKRNARELRCSVSYILLETRAIICLTGLHSRKNKSGCTGGRILERKLNSWRRMVTVACYAGLPHFQNIKHNRISNLIMKSSNIFYENNHRRRSLVPYATTTVQRLYQVL